MGVWEYGSMGVYRQLLPHMRDQPSTARACEYIYATAEKTPISDYPVYMRRSAVL